MRPTPRRSVIAAAGFAPIALVLAACSGKTTVRFRRALVYRDGGLI